MNRNEHLLVCLAEECAEVQHAIAKALRFGLDDGYPGGGTTNAKDIERELIDLSAVIELCREEGVIERPGKSAQIMYADKRKRVKNYMAYAIERGTLT